MIGAGTITFETSGVSPSNGLSLNAANELTLGQDYLQSGNPAELKRLREIPMGGYGIQFSNASAGIEVKGATTSMQLFPHYLHIDGYGGIFEAIPGNGAYAAIKLTNGAESAWIANGQPDDTQTLPADMGAEALKQGLNIVQQKQGYSLSLSNAGGGVQYRARLNAGNHSHRWYSDSVEQMKLNSTGGSLELLVGGIKTVQPSATGAGLWKFGKKVTAAVTFKTTDYLEIDVDGTIYKLAICN